MKRTVVERVVEMETSKSKEVLCPGCGKEVDPLRAGHVSIDAFGFRYFCGLDCKRAYVEVASKRASVDALTAEPPRVSSHRSSSSPLPPSPPSRATLPESAVERTVARGAVASPSFREKDEGGEASAVAPSETRARSDASSGPSRSSDVSPAPSRPGFPREEGAGAAFDPMEDEPADGPDDRSEGADEASDGDELADGEAPDASPDDDTPDGDTPDDEAPSTLRSPTSVARPSRRRSSEVRGASERPPASTREPTVRELRDWFATFVVPAAIACGVLSTVVSLAGEGAASVRLPLALVAVAVLCVRTAMRRRAEDEASPWLVAAPPVVAASLALAAVLVEHRAHPGVYAAFAGLSAASALLVDKLFARARRDVVEARERFAAVLSGPVRVLTRMDSEATRADDDAREVREVAASDVRPGEQIVVEAGETIGVDGVVAAGSADVAPWIDASVVMKKSEGDAVVAGATVLSGKLRVTATFAGADRAWLRGAHGKDGRSDLAPPFVVQARRFVERGVPVVALAIAAITYVSERSWFDAVLAACAGAFALAATSAVAAAALAHARGHVAAFHRGIVYKDARVFDVAARADLAVVCSRGTLLLGEPEIVAVEATAGRDTERVLALAAGAETASRGAVAAAIQHEAKARNVTPESVRSALVHPGLGVTALVANGEKVVVGSRAFLLREKVSVAVVEGRVSELEAQGRSVVLVALGGRLVGLLALQDGIRAGARAAVQRMHDARIEPVLLSGESRETCATIARSLDIEHVRPEVLPADRDAEVRSLVEGGHVIAVVGHPASDEGALGAADVSVAMGAAGLAPGPREWGVALASDDVRDAALSLTIPRACRERAKKAAVACAAGQAVATIGVAFGGIPPILAPIATLLAAVVALSMVREPTTTIPPASYT